MTVDDAKLRDEEAAVRAAARDLDYDRYLAALLAPQSARNALMAIAAFHGEIARIPVTVREPVMVEIRLQWWREALADRSAQEATGAPLADWLRRAIAAGLLPEQELASIIDAYAQLLHPGALHDAGAVDAFADASQGAAFRLAARPLGNAETPASAALIAAAARAYGRVQLLRALPPLLSKGRNPLSDGATVDWDATLGPLLADTRACLTQARRSMALAPATMPAVLPAALVEPYLAALEGLGPNIACEQATISPLSRVWRILQARWRGRF
ncbi:MAG: squalene/phytoene synthase family protein [Hyphomicrobium sp.]|uniref:squalene/phytoene synthase family protein n=1 Tax=Hyphomicrobium sp. TaxID=82 RepID=UPI0025BAD5E4|nr:squalene/phytoene synthase family protein [Hyphomicrobium sp.]MBZ0210649.1 squalene/phytoene synthase family protein [Hyphomicrobium sp.]